MNKKTEMEFTVEEMYTDAYFKRLNISKITDDLYIDYNKSKIYLFNRFDKGSELRALVDHDFESNPKKVLYHVFLGDDVNVVRDAIIKFIDDEKNNSCRASIVLIDVDEGLLVSYVSGIHIASLIRKQEKFKRNLPQDIKDKPFFVLAYHIFYYKCKCCGEPSLRDDEEFTQCDKCFYINTHSREDKDSRKYNRLVYLECKNNNYSMKDYIWNNNFVETKVDEIIINKYCLKKCYDEW